MGKLNSKIKFLFHAYVHILTKLSLGANDKRETAKTRSLPLLMENKNKNVFITK